MKAKLWYQQPYWFSKLPPRGLIQRFLTFDAAAFSIESYYKRHARFEKAIKIVFDLDESKCSVDERDMIHRLQRCGVITKKMYGWLRGIQERQKI